MSEAEVMDDFGVDAAMAKKLLAHPKFPDREKYKTERNWRAKVTKLIARVAPQKKSETKVPSRGRACEPRRPARSNPEMVDRLRKERRTVTEVGPSPAWRRKRRACRGPGKLRKWLMTFLPELFYNEFSPDHLLVIQKVDNAIHYGATFTMAMPRGDGKTSICKGGGLYALLEGYSKFQAPIGADRDASRQFIDFYKKQLQYNQRIKEAYQPVTGYLKSVTVDGEEELVHTGYISHGEGVALRYKSQLRTDGSQAMAQWSDDKIVLPTTLPANRKKMMVYCSGSVAMCKGITCGVRGLVHNMQDGAAIRPDLAILDDPQTRESAESPQQTAKRDRVIRGEVMGLAGPNTRISIMMPCTIIQRGDLADRYLDREKNPGFQGETVSMVKEWPAAQETLWAEYREIYENEKRNDAQKGCPEAATKFYRQNRKAMDAGAVVSWEKRYRSDEISALQCAQNLRIELGDEAFFAEYQNDPIVQDSASYEITAELVKTRVNRLPRLEFGEHTHFAVVHVDVNKAGLHWTAMASGTEFAGNVAGWGKYPKGRHRLWTDDGSDGLLRKQAIYKGLGELLDQLAATNWTRGGAAAALNLVLIDCGFEMDTVFKFCRFADRKYSFMVLASRGEAHSKYRLPAKGKLIGKPGDGYHVTSYAGKGKVLIHNTDKLRMETQKAFLVATGAPGSISLYGDDGKRHDYFASHICAEKLVENVVTDKGEFFKWAKAPSQANDLLDSTVGSKAGLYFLGCHDAGIPNTTKKKRRRRGKSTIKV
jgi:hypothetical protein